ncbi:MAG: helix-turn-helix domain-containing protein [Acidobacteria bacterium]|nr:helix-turn-helix domain-containing protein [Acidobacteriota bacterium]
MARALEANGNDYNAAARALGLHPSNLYRLVRQFRNSDSQE